MLVYGLDGRFNRIVPVKADVGKGKDAGGRSAGKAVEAVTHWKLLGSSVRPLLLSRSMYWLTAHFRFLGGPGRRRHQSR